MIDKANSDANPLSELSPHYAEHVGAFFLVVVAQLVTVCVTFTDVVFDTVDWLVTVAVGFKDCVTVFQTTEVLAGSVVVLFTVVSLLYVRVDVCCGRVVVLLIVTSWTLVVVGPGTVVVDTEVDTVVTVCSWVNVDCLRVVVLPVSLVTTSETVEVEPRIVVVVYLVLVDQLVLDTVTGLSDTVLPVYLVV